MLPNIQKDFILHTDASAYALGAVLSQRDENGDLHPVGYASRSLKDAETRYSVFEKELLAIVWGVANFRQYLYGRHFVLFCDQQSLSRALQLKDCSRVSRWAEALQNYDMTIKHTPGKDNVPADVLSRAVNVAQVNNTQISIDRLSNDKIAELLSQDPKCKEILNNLIDKDSLTLGQNTFFKINNVLYCHQNHKSKLNINDKLVVPKTLISEILSLAHDSPTSAHPGFMRTLNKIRKNYYWHNMRVIILNYIKSCVQCLEKRGYQKGQKAPLQRMPIANRPFEIIGMDAVGPLPLTMKGNKHIIVISDYFSRWVEGYPVPDLKTDTVAETLEKFISTHGVPEHLITDRGTSFMSKAIQSVYEKFKIRKHSTSAYHPASDGVTERANGIVINALKHLVSSTDYQWDRYLHLALMAYRTSFHSTIQDTPAHVVFGRDLVLPVDLLTQQRKFSYADTRDYVEDLEIRLQEAFDLVRQNLEKAAEKQENYRAKRATDKHIAVGDLVLLHTPATKPGQSRKFQNFNKGPYRVKANRNVVNYQISHINDPKDTQWVHVDRLTKIEERLLFPSFFEAESDSDRFNVQQSNSQSTAAIDQNSSNNLISDNLSSDDNLISNSSSINVPNFSTYKIIPLNKSIPNNNLKTKTRVVNNSKHKQCPNPNFKENLISEQTATTAVPGCSHNDNVSDVNELLSSTVENTVSVQGPNNESNNPNISDKVSPNETNISHDRVSQVKISQSMDSSNESNLVDNISHRPKFAVAEIERPNTRSQSKEIRGVRNSNKGQVSNNQSVEVLKTHPYNLRKRK